MKICIAVTTDITFDQRIIKIASSLSKHGYKVTVIGRKKKKPVEAMFPFETQWLSCWFNSSVLFYAEYNMRLFFRMLFSTYDVHCACDLDTLPAMATAANLKSKKLVFDAHEYFEESVEIVHKKHIQKIWEWIGKMFIPFSKLRYTVSESLAEELTKKYGRKFYVVRNMPGYLPGNKEYIREKVIWYQGAINAGRGLECMIDCIVELPGYIFKLAGEGDLFVALKEQVKRKQLENRIVFLGRLNQKELLQHSEKAFIGIDLLDAGSKSYYYSLSNKSLDYIQSRLPCLRMNFPEYRRLQGQFETGILIDKIDKFLILDAIHQFEDESRYNRLLTECHKAAENYNWESEEEILLELYKQLL